MSAITTISQAVLGQAELLDHVLPHELHRFGTWAITNHVLMVALAGLLTFVVMTYVGMRARVAVVPTGVHNLFESILSFFRTDVFRPALGDNADRFAPFLWTVFFFVLFCNLLGMIPMGAFLGLSGQQRLEQMWGTATANFSVTGALAIVAFITVQASGIIQAVRIKMDPSLAPHHHGKDHAQPHGHGQMHGAEGIEDERDVVLEHKVGDGHDHAHGTHHSQEFGGQAFPVAVVTGIGTYIWNFAPHPKIGWAVLDVGMWFCLLLLETMGALVKPFSLCVRLFANMVAGHLVLAALIALIPLGVGATALATGSIGVVVVAGCTALSCLELFVAFLQAYIFTFLCCLYIASAVAPEH